MGILVTVTRTTDPQACAAYAAPLMDRLEAAHRLHRGALKQRTRDPNILCVRSILIHALRARGYSYPEIGTTVHHSHTSIMRLMQSWPLPRAQERAERVAGKAMMEEAEATVGEILASARAHPLPPVSNMPPHIGIGSADLHDPERRQFAAMVACLREAPEDARPAMWAAYTRTAYPHTHEAQARVLPAGGGA